MRRHIIAKDFEAFQSITYEELCTGLDYLASRYAAAKDQLSRNCSDGVLAAQTEPQIPPITSITTTMDVYNEATMEQKIASFQNLEGKFKLG